MAFIEITIPVRNISISTTSSPRIVSHKVVRDIWGNVVEETTKTESTSRISSSMVSSTRPTIINTDHITLIELIDHKEGDASIFIGRINGKTLEFRGGRSRVHAAYNVIRTQCMVKGTFKL